MLRATAVLVLACLAAAPARADRKADREALKAEIDGIIERTALARSRVGVRVVSLDDGDVVYSRNADDLLNPASNVKLFTTAAALTKLGPDYRFDTEFVAERPARGSALTPDGVLKGPLYVRGRADPSINNERLYGIVTELAHAGLKQVDGDLVLDDTFFDGQTNGPGFDQEWGDRAYLAPVSALSLNWNSVAIYASPGEGPGRPARIEVEPPSDFFVIENQALTAGPRAMRRVVAKSLPQGDHQKILAWGRVPEGAGPWSVWKKVDAPTLYFGHTLKEMLGLRGIRVKGRVRLGTAPQNTQALYVHQSDTLDLILKRVNKNSSNFIAEMLLKTLGARFRNEGSWPAGCSVVEEFLADEVGIPRGTFIQKNGSGLNDTNRFSSAQIAKLLVYMWKRFPLAPEYLSSLGIAGKDGTIHYRMVGTDAVGRLRAKTGTLENVTALSGYVQAVSGERFVFSMMVNDYPDRASPVIAGLDAIGAALAAHGGQGSVAERLARALDLKPQPGPLAVLEAKLPVYAALGEKHDRRNVTFLRTALSTERDPAMRAVVAEAIWQSDPDDAQSVRTLLENFDPSADTFGRLRQAGRDLSTATPVLGSLERIAAEGNAEAMGRLLEVMELSRNDPALGEELLEPLGEISRDAPDELIGSLRLTSEATQALALDLLAKSLVHEADPEHPFPLAVRRTQGAVDPTLATFAKGLDEALSVRIAAQKAPPGKAPEADAPLAPQKAAPPLAPPGTGAQAVELHPGG